MIDITWQEKDEPVDCASLELNADGQTKTNAATATTNADDSMRTIGSPFGFQSRFRFFCIIAL
ncbi:MAG: hypothetical protein A3H25_10720 [Sphingomonadales bacterium RIFCSPLOWO2_12_FULL_63_15]|nr:MAG: hypothetical protein A3H25_10720 [Sphingomonadales bacterium RIFCSPLOWO2_12_FULL_63_15]